MMFGQISLDFGPTKFLKLIQGNTESFLENIMLGNVQILNLFLLQKTHAEKNPEYPTYNFLKILNSGSISTKKEMVILYFSIEGT